MPKRYPKDHEMTPKSNQNQWKDGGEERKGEERERKGEEKRGQERWGEERRRKEANGARRRCASQTASIGGGLINLKGGGPLLAQGRFTSPLTPLLAPAGENFWEPGLLRTFFFRCKFSHRFLMTFWRPPDPQKFQKWIPKRAKILPETDSKMKRKNHGE